MAQDPPSRALRIVAILIVGPVLVLAYRTGTRITAEREADGLLRPLCATTVDGRPDPRSVLHITRGSDALLEVLERTVRQGPLWQRAPIARALGASKRVELLKPLVTILRDGCVEPEQVAGTRPGWPFRVLPPDELALSLGDAGAQAMTTLAGDPDPYVRAYAHTYELAAHGGSIDAALVATLGAKDVLLRERAAALVVRAISQRDIPLVGDAAPALAALAAPTPLGRVAARLVLERYPALLPEGSAARRFADELSPADLTLARDERAGARAARSLARGDPDAVVVLEELAPRDAGSLDALVAAVESSNPIAVRRSAVAALARGPAADERVSAALERLAHDPDPTIQATLRSR